MLYDLGRVEIVCIHLIEKEYEGKSRVSCPARRRRNFPVDPSPDDRIYSMVHMCIDRVEYVVKQGSDSRLDPCSKD